MEGQFLTYLSIHTPYSVTPKNELKVPLTLRSAAAMPYKDFTIRLGLADVPRLGDILRSIPEEEVKRLQVSSGRIRMYTILYCVFGILHAKI